MPIFCSIMIMNSVYIDYTQSSIVYIISKLSELKQKNNTIYSTIKHKSSQYVVRVA